MFGIRAPTPHGRAIQPTIPKFYSHVQEEQFILSLQLWYWLNYLLIQISKGTSGFTINTILMMIQHIRDDSTYSSTAIHY